MGKLRHRGITACLRLLGSDLARRSALVNRALGGGTCPLLAQVCDKPAFGHLPSSWGLEFATPSLSSSLSPGEETLCPLLGLLGRAWLLPERHLHPRVGSATERGTGSPPQCAHSDMLFPQLSYRAAGSATLTLSLQPHWGWLIACLAGAGGSPGLTSLCP